MKENIETSSLSRIWFEIAIGKDMKSTAMLKTVVSLQGEWQMEEEWITALYNVFFLSTVENNAATWILNEQLKVI